MNIKYYKIKQSKASELETSNYDDYMLSERGKIGDQDNATSELLE